MKKNQVNEHKRKNQEDTTKYGETISSSFKWITPEKQKDRAKELENMGKIKGQNKLNN